MNLFLTNSELFFTCMNQPKDSVSAELFRELNIATPSAGQDSQDNSSRSFCLQDVQLDFSLVNNGVPIHVPAKRRILLWTPRCDPNTTVLLNNLADGMLVNINKLSRRVSWRFVTVQ